MAPLQICGGTNMRVRRTTILLISLTLMGFLVQPHNCRGAIHPMANLGPNIFGFDLFVDKRKIPFYQNHI